MRLTRHSRHDEHSKHAEPKRPATEFTSHPRDAPPVQQGEHLLHVVNSLESRAIVLDAELREINEDIAQNTAMSRKYGDQFFSEGGARLAQAQVPAPSCPHPPVPAPWKLARRRSSVHTPLASVQAEKQQKLAEIRGQLTATNTSVRQGKQLLGSLTDTARAQPPSLAFQPASTWQNSNPPPTPPRDPGSAFASSPMRVVTTSPILSERHSHRS